MVWLDEYERRARLVPGLLAIFPVAILLSVLSLRQLPTASYAMGAVVLIGTPVVVADIVRQQGRKVEETLWAGWGGPPTTAWLRLREPSGNEVQRDLWRKAVAEVSRVELLGLRAERANPSRADQAIAAAVGQVRDRTRDNEKFKLLFNENRNYGFARNLYGVRWIGRGISLGGVLVVGAHMAWLSLGRHQDGITAENLFGVALCFAFFIYWCLWPSPGRVQEAANKYAQQLLQAAVTLKADAAAAESDPSP
ncbi:hypothetical protein [Streptomyces europaeiscabiei]|uniref:hypothetical protein n=1 Tax=Streptomyces europaeiscabiei TaxID=146819 RepID=UPI0029A87F00|nr:hypothetical protein [Streptomyces europaeiscabiei]MDX3712274.1 hypothetical protein [Streptomyces europaeiscabiei]MDX3866394.1 hypothetical protein [Streptomyces europaeiscabiei]MDX3873006.1 hypothetical protein [Streptomyces europaeiscabiei]